MLIVFINLQTLHYKKWTRVTLIKIINCNLIKSMWSIAIIQKTCFKKLYSLCEYFCTKEIFYFWTLYIVIINYFLKIHVSLYIPSREEKFSKRMLFHLDGRSVKVTAADKISVNNPAIQYNGELTNQNVE